MLNIISNLHKKQELLVSRSYSRGSEKFTHWSNATQLANTVNRYEFSQNVPGEKEGREGLMSMIQEKVTQ